MTPEQKNVKVSIDVHKKLKLHVVKNNINICTFVDEAVLEKIKSDNRKAKEAKG
jgi:hypothetical protein